MVELAVTVLLGFSTYAVFRATKLIKRIEANKTPVVEEKEDVKP